MAAASDCRTEVLKLGCSDFPISEAVDEVIVHHSDCLHVCINNGGTHEAESALFQVFAERIGFSGGRGNLLHNFPAVHFGLSADKAPCVCIKTVELLLNCEKRPRVAHSRLDFLPVSNDSWIDQQLLNALVGISRHFVGIELAEGAAIALTLVEDDRPA
jgi:hypothetical protein